MGKSEQRIGVLITFYANLILANVSQIGYAKICFFIVAVIMGICYIVETFKK